MKRNDTPFLVIYPFLEFEVICGGDSLNREVLRVDTYIFPNSWIRPNCKGYIWWINNSFLQVHMHHIKIQRLNSLLRMYEVNNSKV